MKIFPSPRLPPDHGAHQFHYRPPRTRCGYSSAPGRSPTAPARMIIRGSSRTGCRCSTSAARGRPGRRIPHQGATRRDRCAHPPRAGGGKHRSARTATTCNDFLERGGGLVVIHAGTVSRDPDWFKGIVGGSWRNGTTKWLEGPMHLYFTDRDNPITKGASNFDRRRDLLRHGHRAGGARARHGLHAEAARGAQGERAEARRREAAARREHLRHPAADVDLRAHGGRRPHAYRAFVSIPGHLYENFNRPNYRAILLRGIAWAGKRANVDELLQAGRTRDALRYVEGGPTAPAKAAAKLEVHPEFNLTLVAAEPLINKPMNIDWDEQAACGSRRRPSIRTAAELPNTGGVEGQRLAAAGEQERNPQDTHLASSPTPTATASWTRSRSSPTSSNSSPASCFHKNGVIAAQRRTSGSSTTPTATRRGQAHEALHRPRHRRHARRHQQSALGLDGWIYATHGYSAGNVTSARRHEELRPRRQRRRALQARWQRVRAIQLRGGNTWGLDITWDDQVIWTQPTSGTCSSTSCCPRTCSRKGKAPWHHVVEGHDHRTEAPIPLMTWRAGLCADRPGRPVHRGGGLRDLRRRRVAREVHYALLHHRADDQHRPSAVREARRRDLHDRRRPGREETEFIRSSDMWFRPIETRVGPDGAL